MWRPATRPVLRAGFCFCAPAERRHCLSDPSKTAPAQPIYDVADLQLGAHVSGPAIVAAPTTTIVLHEGDVLSREIAEGFLIEVGGAAGSGSAGTAGQSTRAAVAA